MTLTHKHIVAIDDSPAIRDFLRIMLEAHGATFHEAATASYGLALCEQINPDLVVLDLGLPDKEGLTILPRLKRLRKNGTPVVVLTVRNEQRFREMALEMGADAYLTKPFVMEDLIEVMEQKMAPEAA